MEAKRGALITLNDSNLKSKHLIGIITFECTIDTLVSRFVRKINANYEKYFIIMLACTAAPSHLVH